MTNKETIYRQDVLDLAKKGVLISNGSYKSVCKAINEIPPVNPQSCEDAISRQAVIDSLHSKFADGFGSDRWWNSMSVLYAINKVPPVNPIEPCKDAIDRAEAMTKMLAENVKSDEEDIYIKVSAVVQLLRELSSVNSQHSGDLISKEKTLTAFADYVGSGMSMDDYDALWDIVAKMPAVKQEPRFIAKSDGTIEQIKDNPTKTGHWIEHKNNGMAYIECSECSSWFLRIHLTRNSYCPNCGVRMVEPQERSDKG